jgi:hypothetical protein
MFRETLNAVSDQGEGCVWRVFAMIKADRCRSPPWEPGTHAWVVTFIDTDRELADPVTVSMFYFPAARYGTLRTWALEL